jgi:hypothetical protein
VPGWTTSSSSWRRVTLDAVHDILRSGSYPKVTLRRGQTPQCFRLSVIG